VKRKKHLVPLIDRNYSGRAGAPGKAQSRSGGTTYDRRLGPWQKGPSIVVVGFVVIDDCSESLHATNIKVEHEQPDNSVGVLALPSTTSSCISASHRAGHALPDDYFGLLLLRECIME